MKCWTTSPLLAAFLMLVPVAGSILGQERQILFEEIQQMPPNLEGEWIIGGKPLIVGKSSLIRPRELAEIGALAVVEFMVNGDEAFVTQMAPQSIKAAEINDGPYVNWIDKTTARVITIKNGKLEQRDIKNITEPRDFKNPTSLVESIRLDPDPPTPPKSQWEMPARLLAISDLEGNYHNARRFLENCNVINRSGHWNWGDGHLVLVGDLVDRGDHVTELMWLIRQLERESAAAGGRVHYVLGNHEAMVMGGDLRYIHRKYHFTSTRIGMRYDQLHGESSEIGRWWRSKNGVIRVGNLLFVHGGYSPKLDSANLDIDSLNRLIRQGLPPAQPVGLTAATNPVRHPHGPFWYRGYFEEHATAWGGLASQSEISHILERHQAKHVVIGHTVVDEVGPINDSGSVIAIDVKWAESARCQGLLQERGKLYRVMSDGDREEIRIQTHE